MATRERDKIDEKGKIMPSGEKTKSVSIEVRFQNRLVQMPNGCIEWTGSRSERGYGQISVHGGDRMVRTHRLAWTLAYGEIPEGMNVCHSCDNPPCCNIEHLWLGTQADNVADMVAKGRNSGRPTKAQARVKALVADALENNLEDDWWEDTPTLR